MGRIEAAGGRLIDGSCTWIVVDTRDMTPVGAVRGSLFVPPGYLKADGRTVAREKYPRLVHFADMNDLWTDDPKSNAGLFGRGDGVTTFQIPNWIDRMMQLANDSAGLSIEAGLPNITGRVRLRDGASSHAYSETFAPMDDPDSAFYTTDNYEYGNRYNGEYYIPGGGRSILRVDASRCSNIYGASDTVQPAAIRLVPVIRY